MLQLPGQARNQMLAEITAGYPYETCGLLVGRQDDDGASVVRCVTARNLNSERARDRFQLDPDDFRRADDDARADGLDVVGIWHSHPDHPAQPSETDRAAAWEGWSYLIASVTTAGVSELRSWRLFAGRFLEEELKP